MRTLGVMVTTAEYPLSLPPIDQNMRVQKIFNGYLRITNENFVDAYENSNSTEFANLANRVKEAVSPVPGQGAPALLSALAHPPSPRPKGHGSLPSRSLAGAWEGGTGRGVLLPLSGPLVSPVSFPQLKLLYSGVPSLGPYHKKSMVTAFRWVLGRGLVGQGARSRRSGPGEPGPFVPRSRRCAPSRAGRP